MKRLLKKAEIEQWIIDKYTQPELELLRSQYESPLNEYKHLSFNEWIKALEENDLMKDMLDDN
jgi:hypothetical protein